jgi:hypothetical protein
VGVFGFYQRKYKLQVWQKHLKTTVMNARSYRVNLSLTPVDFPAIMGLGQSSVSYQSEPHINKKNVILAITKKYVLTDINTNKDYEVISVKCDYEIPSNLIRNREDVYEFYKDATLSLNEAYQYARTQLPALPNIQFPNQPIENYKGEIDRVFSLLNSQN